jgi:hypothetical protein
MKQARMTVESIFCEIKKKKGNKKKMAHLKKQKNYKRHKDFIAVLTIITIRWETAYIMLEQVPVKLSRIS